MKTFKNLFSIKWLLIMVATFAITASLTACDDDESDAGTSSVHPLTGTWLGLESQSGTERMYLFNTDGSGYTKSLPNGRQDNFTDYKVENGRLYILWDGDDNYDYKGSIRLIDNNTFEIDFNDNGFWYTYHRQ